MESPRRIFLTGFMGCGKSSIGPLVAATFGHAFVDLDDEILRHAGKSIRALFEDGGEEAFRIREQARLQEVVQRSRVTVALGGGALSFGDNLRTVLRRGIVVFLDAPVDVLVRRLEQGQANRPLLCDSSGTPLSSTALEEKIKALRVSRMPVYRKAHVTVKINSDDSAANARSIVDAVSSLDDPIAF